MYSLFVNDDPGVHKMRHFCGHPWCKPETERMRDAEARRVFGPERLEMDGEAYFAATVHFRGSVVRISSNIDGCTYTHTCIYT